MVRERGVLARLSRDLERNAAKTQVAQDEYALGRLGTAATLLALNELAGEVFYCVAPEAAVEQAAAESCFGSGRPVIDVQTHLVDADKFHGPHADALAGFLKMVDPNRWSDGVDTRHIDGAAWAALVFGASETAIALLTSTPGTADNNVLTNHQIAAVRDLVARYADAGRVLTHTIVHPNHGRAELDAMATWAADLTPSAWKVYTLAGPPTSAAPTGGWYLDDDEIGFAFLDRVMQFGPRIVCAHKGLGGPIPDASVETASPRDIGPAAVAFPDITFVVYHSGYERNPNALEVEYRPEGPASGVDRLVRTLADVGLAPGANVYAELGSTWFLMIRRPLEAAHVLGKLLAAVGPDRILWGTDSAWYGSPQPLIDAFRAFTIPQWMQHQFGYPEFTDEIKDRILSRNAQQLYGVSDRSLEAARLEAGAWVVDGAPALRRALSAVHD